MKKTFLTLLTVLALTACESKSEVPAEDPMDVSGLQNEYSPTGIGVDDSVGSMRVVSIEPLSEENPLSDDNAVVTFEGQVTLTGEAWRSTLFEGHCFGGMDQESLSQLPKAREDARETWFCFSNKDLAEELIGENQGMATVVIDQYVDRNTEVEAWNTARLVEVLSQD